MYVCMYIGRSGSAATFCLILGSPHSSRNLVNKAQAYATIRQGDPHLRPIIYLLPLTITWNSNSCMPCCARYSDKCRPNFSLQSNINYGGINTKQYNKLLISAHLFVHYTYSNRLHGTKVTIIVKIYSLFGYCTFRKATTVYSVAQWHSVRYTRHLF